jgi:hypothetical protein
VAVKYATTLRAIGCATRLYGLVLYKQVTFVTGSQVDGWVIHGVE